MKLKEFLEPDRETREWEWWIVATAFFVCGGLWAVPMYQRLGVAAMQPFVLTGILMASLAFAAGRASRYVSRYVRLRSDMRSDNLGISPIVATVLMIAITIALAIVLYLMVSHILGA